MRTVIADPCPFARAGMRQELQKEEDIEIVATVPTGAEAVDCLLRPDVDSAVVHTDMGDMDGFAVARLSARHANVVLRSAGDPAMDAAEALRAGAHGVVSHSSGTETVLAALHETGHRDIYLEPSVLRRLLGPEGSSSVPAQEPGLECLTDREQEVLLLVGQGLDNRDIAARLTVSEGTVKTHVNRVMTKLQLPSRARLVVFCYENTLITPAIRIPREIFSRKRQPAR
ncbi:LuxR C-terminal-related transcriptional regulator [Nocardiopsis terrae]